MCFPEGPMKSTVLSPSDKDGIGYPSASNARVVCEVAQSEPMGDFLE